MKQYASYCSIKNNVHMLKKEHHTDTILEPWYVFCMYVRVCVYISNINCSYHWLVGLWVVKISFLLCP